MTKSNLRSQIEETIKKQNLQPTAKWFFDVQNIGLWILGVFALSIGSLAVAVSLHVLFSNDWSLAEELSGGNIPFILSTLPYVWIAAVIVFLLVAEHEVRKTKHGYKYATLHIGGGLVLFTIVVGGVLFATGIGAATEDAFAHRMPGYKEFGNRQYMIWSSPEDGRLAGIVAIVEDEDHFVLVDMKGGLWDVTATDATYPTAVIVSEQKQLKLLGEKKSEVQFLAKVVLPFHKGPEVPRALKYRHELHKNSIETFIKQSRERNFSSGRNRE